MPFIQMGNGQRTSNVYQGGKKRQYPASKVRDGGNESGTECCKKETKIQKLKPLLK